MLIYEGICVEFERKNPLHDYFFFYFQIACSY